MKAVFDRIEDNQYAVFLVEDLQKSFTVEKKKLPADAKIHSWFDVTIADGKIIALLPDEKLTKEKQTRTDSLIKEMQKKKKESKFKRR
ncbi:DUF3006 family protein [Bacillaceae bacterium Marseille-Q3522]|nr:DUF3006 family protein [Bacillaceae bacterium Marseille-Q3522]